MTKNERQGSCIVVGYDGSAEAEAAVEYALDRAGPDGCTVIVHAFEPPSDITGFPAHERALEDRRNRARAVIDALVMEDGEELFDADFETELVAGSAADAVMQVARERDADEIVVGSRGFGRTRALLGSTSHELVHRADRPLVVIPRVQMEEAVR